MAKNIYEVSLSNGKAYDVTTPHHHTDHDEDTFKKHLLDVIKGTVSGVMSTVVTRYVFKGKK